MSKQLDHTIAKVIIESFEDLAAEFWDSAKINTTDLLFEAVATISDNEFPVALRVSNDGWAIEYPDDRDPADVLDHFTRALMLARETLEETN